MSRIIMTALAKLRRGFNQKLGMVAAVRCMTVQAIFIDRRMLYHKRPSLFGMALVTKFIHRIGLKLIVGEGAVRIMAAGAFD